MCIQEKITDEFRSQVQKAQNSLFEIQSKVKSENTDFLEGVNFKVSAEDLKNFEGFLYDQLEESEDNKRIGGVLDSPYLVGVLSWTQNFLKYFFKEVYEIICIEQQAKEISQASDISMKGIATSLAAWMVSALGFTGPLAIGLATAVLLILAKATKGAFCQMSHEQIQTSLKLDNQKINES